MLFLSGIWSRSSDNTACSHGTLTVAQLLIDQGAGIDTAANHGWTPLHWACLDGLLPVVSMLLGNGADIRYGVARWS